MVETLGFVGFGEAAFHLAKGLREAGVKRTLAYDVNAHTPRLGETIEARARETRTELVEFSAALAASAGVIISAVTADQATAAEEIGRFMQALRRRRLSKLRPILRINTFMPT